MFPMIRLETPANRWNRTGYLKNLTLMGGIDATVHHVSKRVTVDARARSPGNNYLLV
ncbi:zinc finger protein basonuclin-1 isoform X4 [Anopheles sinensis]|uniref:Zinc finger protein basonuclin-1 isoform X4 n=1 Tax=Anopheles sinensis TaxID=74873 RepID=A0A084WF99_ANOSI|nr:zinc finger protein basonuclin-1 isoform X4 [Anopheles sinensis]